MSAAPAHGTADVFSLSDVTFRYAGAGRAALEHVAWRVSRGSIQAVLGPNGSGKSTLLRLLLGRYQPQQGAVAFEGRPLATYSRRSLALAIGVVTQDEEHVFPATVRELVAMGRYPHLGPLRPERASDRAAVEAALDRCDLLGFGERPIGTLSGGERQRGRVLLALAQEPRVLVLDEPTAALDVRHEMEIFELLARLAQDGVSVILVTHQLNLAARYAHGLLLLAEGRVAAAGAPADVLTRDALERVYRWPVTVMPFPGPGRGAGAPQVLPLAPQCPDG
jgi:ABC-type cobalamin/Fe3+-siderophores transport system ATPase subunit